MPRKPNCRKFRPDKRKRSPRPNRSRRKECETKQTNEVEVSKNNSENDSNTNEGSLSSENPTSNPPTTSPVCEQGEQIVESAAGTNSLIISTQHEVFSTSDDLHSTDSTIGTVDDFASDTMSVASSSACDTCDTDCASDCGSSSTAGIDSSRDSAGSVTPTAMFSMDNMSHTLSASECKDILNEVNLKLGLFLPNSWISRVETDSINLLLLSRKEEKAIQRRINYSSNGRVTLSIHGKIINCEHIIQECTHPGALSKQAANSVVDYIVSIMNKVRSYEICSGADHVEYKEAWQTFPNSYIDQNFFQECRYEETLRVDKCLFLVEPKRWRCTECCKVVDRLRKRIVSLKKEEADPRTANIHLTKQQSMNKLKSQHRKIEAGKKKIERLQEKIRLLIKNEGMNVDEDLFELMQSAVEEQNLNPLQSLFLQQQLKACQCKSSKGMRWHPAMIQFALSLFLASPAAYNIMQTSGMMKLPSSRTLYDYSHVFEDKEGICMPILKNISERLSKLPALKSKWHTLLCDEMHISKTIVYHKASGTIVGYVKRNDADQAMSDLQAYLDNAEKTEPEVANKVLAFMVKGVANDVKEVVASFSVNKLTSQNLYSKTWDVIAECERSGIQIIVMTSDGNAVNRAFFKMNTPITPTESGIVFVTINKAAPSRPLFFISDVPHLIKTIRNNFYNSRLGKKSKRCLTKNGQKILWSTIVRLYNTKKAMPLRKSYKLNAANVHPDSYSCMKVGYAFQVLSKTVGKDIEAQGWEGTSETVTFILKVNDVSDCLNGAHSSMGIKKKKPLLNPYRSEDDSRFTEFLLPFLDYLEEWKEEAMKADATIQNQTTNNPDDPDGSFHSLHDIHESPATDGENPEHPAHKRILCRQTLEGIEIAIRGFIGAVKYLLTVGGVDFINPRVFCQDHLEQFFSKQRQRGGGSNCPNVLRYRSNARSIHVQRGLSVRKRSANTLPDDPYLLCNEKMPRRQSARSKNSIEIDS